MLQTIVWLQRELPGQDVWAMTPYQAAFALRVAQMQDRHDLVRSALAASVPNLDSEGQQEFFRGHNY